MGGTNSVFDDRRRRRAAAEEAERQRIIRQYESIIDTNDPDKVQKASDYYDAYSILENVKERKEKALEILKKAQAEVANVEGIIAGNKPPDGAESRSFTEEKKDGKIRRIWNTGCGNLIREYDDIIADTKDKVKGMTWPDLRQNVIDATTAKANAQALFDEAYKLYNDYLDQNAQKAKEIIENDKYIELLHLKAVGKEYVKYKEIKTQNDFLKREIKVYGDTYSSDETKIIYKDQHTNELIQTKTYFLFFYYGLVFLLTMEMFFLSKLAIEMKIGLVILSMFYPYLIYYIEVAFYEFYLYMFG
jgi:hypothetical protein